MEDPEGRMLQAEERTAGRLPRSSSLEEGRGEEHTAAEGRPRDREAGHGALGSGEGAGRPRIPSERRARGCRVKALRGR